MILARKYRRDEVEASTLLRTLISEEFVETTVAGSHVPKSPETSNETDASGGRMGLRGSVLTGTESWPLATVGPVFVVGLLLLGPSWQ